MSIKEQKPEGYNLGALAGRQFERERIIKLLEDEELVATSQNPLKNYDQLVWQGIKEQLIELIKGEQKPIHTHDIEVFGAPCDCGTRHEYCGECDWVEPCEQEGEQK